MAKKEAEQRAKREAEARAAREAAQRTEREAAQQLADAPAAPPARAPHGNLADDRPATFYRKVDEENNLRKWGITKHEDPRKRYSKNEIGGGDVQTMERGPRREMLRKERELVETNPGPDNHEPWAGKRKQQ